MPSVSTDDPDLDGLTNYEEYIIGTDPNDSDSDNGGENDGSEWDLFGQDPLDPSDDEIEALGFVIGYSRPWASLLHYDVAPEYVRLRLYRRSSSFTPYTILDDNISPNGWYLDTGLENGVTYSYKLVAYDSQFHGSAVTDPVYVTPRVEKYYLPIVLG